MAVFTEITSHQVAEILKDYSIGKLEGLKPIAEGVENSNFLLTTQSAQQYGKYIFTIFESRVNTDDLPFYLGLMEHLKRHNIPCPEPVISNSGGLSGVVKLPGVGEKHFAIVTFLPGAQVRVIEDNHCASLGAFLSQMHRAGQGFKVARANALNPVNLGGLYAKFKGRAGQIISGLDDEIESELQYIRRNWPSNLKRGVIHADLFPDNLFFDDKGEAISGVIDFYFACNDLLLYDLAICINAWCFNDVGEYQPSRGRALIGAYNAASPISHDEMAQLPILCRGAALRFLLTRTHDAIFHNPGNLVTPKNPLDYYQRLRFFQSTTNFPFEESLAGSQQPQRTRIEQGKLLKNK
jgi:homoserine kinase type II